MYTRFIPIEEAEQGMVLAEAVYIVTNTGANMMMARKGTELDSNLISVLKRREVRKIEIISETPGENEEVPYVAPPPKTVEVKIQGTPKPPPEKNYTPVKTVVSEKLKDEAVDSVKQLFTCVTAQGGVNKTTAYQCVSELDNVVSDLLSVISSDPTGMIHINDLKHYDEYTYHHSLSVSMLSISTGRVLGLREDELQRLGRCAMMHDIGKQLLSFDIIGKKGKLTEDEFAQVKNHPVLGASSLKAASIGDVELWNAIMFHHEKIDGSGYPKGLKGKDIPLFSKIIAVADVYDAVTSYRPYRSPMLPSEAFEVIRQGVGTHFEMDVVKAFFAKLELYPLNTIVELSDGRLGMVVECGYNQRLRPVVRVWGSTEIVDLSANMNQSISIVSVMNPSDLPPGYEFA